MLTYSTGYVRSMLGDHAPEVIEELEEIPDLEDDFPEAKHWLNNYLLNTRFRARFPDEKHATVLALIRRVQHAFKHYHDGRSRALTFALWDYKGSLPASSYFGSIEAFENSLLQLQMAYALLLKLSPDDKEKIFEPGDGSPGQRVWDIANCVKHMPSYIEDHGDVTPLWLRRNGIEALNGEAIAFAELAEEIRAAALVANELQDPKKLKEQHGADSRGTGETTPDEPEARN